MHAGKLHAPGHRPGPGRRTATALCPQTQIHCPDGASRTGPTCPGSTQGTRTRRKRASTCPRSLNMKKLEVFFCGWGQKWLLGTLADNGKDLLFEYSQAALAKGIEFSPRSLRLQAHAHGDFPEHQYRLPGLIADALPDGWGMLLMDRLFAKLGFERSQISPLDRLAFIGERAVGALTFEPGSDIELAPAALKLLALAKAAKAVIAGKESAALKQLILLGGSPHGARPTVLVHYEGAAGLISTDETAAGTPWLVTFQGRDEHKEVCAVEHLYAQLARNCRLEI